MYNLMNIHLSSILEADKHWYYMLNSLLSQYKIVKLQTWITNTLTP